jgi:transposase InsO family protein
MPIDNASGGTPAGAAQAEEGGRPTTGHRDVALRALGSAQYVSTKSTARLVQAGIEPSVGSVGASYDNAFAETIIHHALFQTARFPGGGLGGRNWRALAAAFWSPRRPFLA